MKSILLNDKGLLNLQDYTGVHELSVAGSILDWVLKEQETRALPSIRAIGLRLGVLSGIFPDALTFSFDAIKKDTALEKTILEISEIAAVALCKKCGHQFTIEDLVFICPCCEGTSVELTNGEEMDITYLDIASEKENCL